MWDADVKLLDAGCIHKFHIRQDKNRLPCVDVLTGLKSDAAFRAFFNQLLADAPFDAFFWEMPPLTTASIEQPFECVLVDSPVLAGVTAEAGSFSEYFPQATDGVTGFANLGNDAWLIAPCPVGPRDVYPHLATFVRGASAAQQQVFWQRTGEAVTARLSDQPLWVSTSGLGVYWLHVRLDSYPKYYTYHPYTR